MINATPKELLTSVEKALVGRQEILDKLGEDTNEHVFSLFVEVFDPKELEEIFAQTKSDTWFENWNVLDDLSIHFHGNEELSLQGEIQILGELRLALMDLIRRNKKGDYHV